MVSTRFNGKVWINDLLFILFESGLTGFSMVIQNRMMINSYSSRFSFFIEKVWFWENAEELLYFGIVFVVFLLLAVWAYKKLRKDIPDVL